jgi:ERCC4-related helicase
MGMANVFRQNGLKGYYGLRCIDKVLVDGMEKLELNLHDFQLALVKPALEGRNTIICAPTGSGKTFVAMEAIKHHVAGPNRKYVAFVVNTVSLVEQQESRLGRYLPESVVVSSVCGSNPDISLPSVLGGADVVVLTAQVLLNSLGKNKPAGEECGACAAEEKELSISQFSLLIFDECHHTTKDHPYNEIMRWYMREKTEVRYIALAYF